MTPDLESIARERGIRHFLVSFTDLAGAQRAKLVPAAAIGRACERGVAFAGAGVHLDLSPADPDLRAVPDPSGLMQLPWKPEVGWLPSALSVGGRPLDQGPRDLLRRVIADAARDGAAMRTGVECEFFLLTPDGTAPADAADRGARPCYDQSALMRRHDVVAALLDAMASLGWGPYQADHEDGQGQFEVNWEHADALVTADRHAFFKFMARSIAEAHGLRATFMPKPFAELAGNGCHAHVSLWRDGRNVFLDEAGELGLSREGHHFIGGVLHSADALAALLAPTVNSYKRLGAPRTASGATLAPGTAGYAGRGRTQMIRIPEGGRFECRLPDGAANPYLLQAALLAAGLDGLRNARDPGPRRDGDAPAGEPQAEDAKRLPTNLLDALRALRRSEVLNRALGAFVPAYLRLKTEEWHAYARHLTQWERDTTLDC